MPGNDWQIPHLAIWCPLAWLPLPLENTFTFLYLLNCVQMTLIGEIQLDLCGKVQYKGENSTESLTDIVEHGSPLAIHNIYTCPWEIHVLSREEQRLSWFFLTCIYFPVEDTPPSSQEEISFTRYLSISMIFPLLDHNLSCYKSLI